MGWYIRAFRLVVGLILQLEWISQNQYFFATFSNVVCSDVYIYFQQNTLMKKVTFGSSSFPGELIWPHTNQPLQKLHPHNGNEEEADVVEFVLLKEKACFVMNNIFDDKYVWRAHHDVKVKQNIHSAVWKLVALYNYGKPFKKRAKIFDASSHQSNVGVTCFFFLLVLLYCKD